MHLRVSYEYQKKQRICRTQYELIGFYVRVEVFTARYELDLILNRLRYLLIGLNLIETCNMNLNTVIIQNLPFCKS